MGKASSSCTLLEHYYPSNPSPGQSPTLLVAILGYLEHYRHAHFLNDSSVHAPVDIERSYYKIVHIQYHQRKKS